MTGGLLLLAAALLLWPGPGALRRERRRSLTWRADAGPRVPATVPLPVVAAASAAAVAGLVSTPLVAALAGGCAALAARAELRRRTGAQEEARLAALVEALTALGAELRSGRSLDEATRAAVAACADDDSGRALARAVRVPEDGAGRAEDADELAFSSEDAFRQAVARWERRRRIGGANSGGARTNRKARAGAKGAAPDSGTVAAHSPRDLLS